MKFLNFKKRSTTPTRDPFDPRFWEALGTSVGGQTVSAVRAEQIAAVYACKTAIAESISMLPCSIISEVDERKKVKNKEHSLHSLLRDAPNPWMDTFDFFEVAVTSMLDTGNFYAHVKRNRIGTILQLTPLDATKTKPVMQAGNQLSYEHITPSGEKIVYSPKDIFHVKYRSKDGLVGRTPIQVASESIGFGLALQQHGLKTFQNGAFLSGFLSVPHSFKDDESRKNFMESFKKVLGASNAGKFGLLEQGVDYKPFSQNNRDAEFLALKQFNVVEIARIYRMPPHMIQELSKGASYASIEQMSIAFVQYTIQPWVTRFERAIKRQLLNGVDEEFDFARFNISALIRGDLWSRTQSVVQQLNAGLKTINEARLLLDENAIDQPIGDEVLLSHNLRPASQAIMEAVNETQQPGIDTQETPKAELDGDELERFRPLLTEMWGRIARRESKLIADARKKGEFDKWACEWLPKHRELVRETFDAVTKALPVKVDITPYLDAYLEEKERQLLVSYDYSDTDIERVTTDMITYINAQSRNNKHATKD